VGKTERMTAAALAERLAGAHPPIVLDVRSAAEHAQKRIEGALNIPLNHLEERAGEVPRGRPVVIHCASGYRSSIGASILEHQGMTSVTDLVGGFTAWETETSRHAGPTQSPRRQ